MERSIWEETQRLCQDKMEWDTLENPMCRHMYQQLLMKIMLLKKTDPSSIDDAQIASKTPQELRPDLWKSIIDKQEKTNEILFETRQEVATDDFTCPKCHQKKCTYYQLQTRSADEPMTTFVSCVNCGKRWKC